VLHPQNPETIGTKLASSILQHSDVDTGIYILSRALEQLCNSLASETKMHEARQLALSAANYARVCRKLAEESREKQKQN
jgi:hypothetical protein